jgi:hypothetical protein
MWRERPNGLSRVIDTTPPTGTDLTNLALRFQDYYPDQDFDAQAATFRWVSGFVRVEDGVDFEVGDDIRIEINGEPQYLQMERGLEITLAAKVYYFFFPQYYDDQQVDRELGNMGPILRVIVKWDLNSPGNLPLTPRVFSQRVLIVHECVRKCGWCRDPQDCICGTPMCKLVPYCVAHRSYTCSEEQCSQTVVKHDVHHQSLKTYNVFNEDWGVKTRM